MHPRKFLDQHIAVFGESGSGKTVLLSSFYGAAQESQNIARNDFNVLAESASQGTRLSKNYLGMKNSAQLPASTHFSAETYPFQVKTKNRATTKRASQPFDLVRLVWHDYPGEWFEQDVSGADEAKRRADTFRSLLSSDVALLLVDGQRLLDNVGKEERYLKSLLTDVRNGLLLLKPELLIDGKPLVRFPRIWVLALSKRDLWPDLNVFGFRDLLIEKAGDDINELREALAGMVEASGALSVGEDFVLLSSAKFSADKIEVTERVGVELILPLAAVLPLQRQVQWLRSGLVTKKVAEHVLRAAGTVAAALGGAGALAAALLGSKYKWAGALGNLVSQFGSALDDVARLGGDKLKAAHDDATAKHDDMKAMMTGFQIDLEKAEAEKIFIRSPR